jgi:formate C-acetyltransferase/4-hydroxyphenylacetate decarboxylase large subunit
MTKPFNLRERVASPLSANIKTMRARYLSEPLKIDIEYIAYYTDAHQKHDGINVYERRAQAHAYAMENLTPVIRNGEPFVGSKTRFVRGAIPYCNYACEYILRELKNESQHIQDKFAEVGTGGGIKTTIELAEQSEYEKFGSKFLISKKDKIQLNILAKYWKGKSMQDLGDRFWKRDFSEAATIEKGWQMGLYTAPHDSAPEGRYVLDFETALSVGFNQIITNIQNKIRHADVTDYASAQKLFFWRSGIRVLKSVISWANHYADEAERLLQKATVAEEKQRLHDIITMCRHVPAHSPRSFKEAIQFFWLVYLAGHIEGAQLGYSPGRFDRYMYPFYKKDKDADTLTDEQALNLLEALRIKMTEIEYMASFSWEGLGSGNLYQNMILGGLTAEGKPADNELSLLIIQAAINCQTTQPTLSIWYDDSLSDAFLLKAAECVKTGVGFPAFFNTKIFIQHALQRSKTSLANIRKYAAIGGCTEPTLEGMSYGIVQPGFVNNVKVFELALNGGTDPQSGISFDKTPLPKSYAELYQYVKFYLRKSIKSWQRYWNYVMAIHHDTCNLIYSSVLIKDCIEKGRSLDDGGAVCNDTPTTLSSGMVNVVNCLAAVKYALNHCRDITMDKIRMALKNNWKNYESMRRYLLNAPKWGNNDAEADNIYEDIFDYYCTLIVEQQNYQNEKYDPSMLAISTHVPFGKACGATPDGRYAGETLADGVTSPSPGTDKNGPLAVLNSAAKLDHTRIRGGLHNMKFSPSSLQGVNGSRQLIQLVKTYFDQLGFQLQFNVVDSRMLSDAQKNPEKYRDLIVRVAGFSAFFVELGKSIQEEIIARTEQKF